jgi:mono/diheme cytochrome c family protein
MNGSNLQVSTMAKALKRYGAVLMGALALSGCAIEWQNREPARVLANEDKPLGSVYAGWRIFQDKCASCHGPDATGSKDAPDLLVRARELGPRSFMSLVLKRYDWGLSTPAGGEASAREAMVDGVMQRKQGALTMPAWQGEPTVTVHIAALYAYVQARSQGLQGPGRPTP